MGHNDNQTHVYDANIALSWRFRLHKYVVVCRKTHSRPGQQRHPEKIPVRRLKNRFSKPRGNKQKNERPQKWPDTAGDLWNPGIALYVAYSIPNVNRAALQSRFVGSVEKHVREANHYGD